MFTPSLAIDVGFGLVHAIRAYEIPTPAQTVDPPGFHNDAADYVRNVKPMHSFIAQLDASVDKGDRMCVLSQLRTWVDADALMGRISGYQGQYERLWVGADFVMVLLRMSSDIHERNQAQLDAIAPWFKRIVIATRNAETVSHLHDNPVYWVGPSLITIDITTGSSDLIDSGLLRIHEGIRDISPDDVLVRKVERGGRALHCHAFALILSMFTAELMQQRHIDLYRKNNHAIGHLANLVVDVVIDPVSFKKTTPIRQTLFPWALQDELCWMEPYYAHVRGPGLPALITLHCLFSKRRLGGNVAAAWSAELSGR